MPAGHTRPVGAIEAYLAELDGALRGPRRVKADLLREARGGLIDAAEAYRTGGMPDAEAECRAVADFGPVPVVAPGYQRELGSAQSLRTAALIGLVLAPQDAIWDAVSRTWHPGGPPPGRAFLAIEQLMSWLGATALAGCLLVVLVHRIGQRYLGVRPGLTRAVGTFAVTVAAVFAGASIAMGLLDPHPWNPAGLAATAGAVVAPMALVARAGWRCVRWSSG